MKKISQLFLQGLIAVLPLALTLFIIFWLGSTAESIMGGVIQWLIPSQWYIPGMGIVVGFFVILMVGLLLNAYIFRRIADFFNGVFKRIPLFKIIYGSVRDVSKFASISKDGGEDELKKAVLVNITDDVQLVGFVTSKTPPLKNKGLVAVYLPMSYQIGGFTLLLPESKIESLEMSVQEAMRFVLTAGITQSKD